MEAKRMKLAGIFGNIPTPIAILRTSCGSLCFTTPDLRSRMEGSFISQLEVGDFMGKSFEKISSEQLIKYDSKSNSKNNGQILSARHMDSNSVSYICVYVYIYIYISVVLEFK